MPRNQARFESFGALEHDARHEAQAVVPESVTGTKDAVDADGTPAYQGIDQSKLVPLLVAAVQELAARVAALEAK
jgi:hypothetical protein